MAIAVPIVDSALKLFDTVIERVFPNPAERDKARLELLVLQQQGATKELEERVKVIVAEAQSQSWLANSWRPITMLAFVAVIVNNYLLFPYLKLFGVDAVMLEMPVHVWDVIELGLGGYVVGRSVEKTASVVADALKKKT
jgi:hypothetical protein